MCVLVLIFFLYLFFFIFFFHTSLFKHGEDFFSAFSLFSFLAFLFSSLSLFSPFPSLSCSLSFSILSFLSLPLRSLPSPSSFLQFRIPSSVFLILPQAYKKPSLSLVCYLFYHINSPHHHYKRSSSNLLIVSSCGGTI